MADSKVETLIPIIRLSGSPAERGRALGRSDPVSVKRRISDYWHSGCSFDAPYFRKNREFMRREFPELIEELEGFGDAAGLTPDEAYFAHVLTTSGREACSALALTHLEEGPVMLRCLDVVDPAKVLLRTREARGILQENLRPHSFAAIGDVLMISPITAVNDAGLAVATASGHPKFEFSNRPETISIYFWSRVIAQYCTNCDDARALAAQYRSSGIKGLNMVVLDEGGNALGIEFESENVAFRRAEGGLLLEVNHWQDPRLDAEARRRRSEFYRSEGFRNSAERVMFVERHRARLQEMRSSRQLSDFAFERPGPGSLLQREGLNTGNWVTASATIVRSRERSLEYHPHPLDPARLHLVSLPSAPRTRAGQPIP